MKGGTEIRLVINALSQSGGGTPPLTRDQLIAAVAEQTGATPAEIAAEIDRTAAWSAPQSAAGESPPRRPGRPSPMTETRRHQHRGQP